jgi:hypothetical protein
VSTPLPPTSPKPPRAHPAIRPQARRPSAPPRSGAHSRRDPRSASHTPTNNSSAHAESSRQPPDTPQTAALSHPAGCRVPLDKSEGVVKTQNSCAVVFHRCVSVVQNRSSETLTVNQLAAVLTSRGVWPCAHCCPPNRPCRTALTYSILRCSKLQHVLPSTGLNGLSTLPPFSSSIGRFIFSAQN